MPIATLSATTVRAIGSSQALTDSHSLVKELIDNAIDGRATAISIEISINTLGEIRVKDNGNGVNPDDRPMLCQRHCTSKIRNLDELRQIGGRSLGFRGEALASAAELSGGLTIITRIEGEETASELKIDRQGHTFSEKRMSHPVGTTVRVERFLEAIPVRKQAAEKLSLKTLGRIRRTLQAYALAKPYLRLSFKVLKAKDEKSNWKYPIHARATSESITKPCPFDAAIDIVGKKVTNQCLWNRSALSSDGDHIVTAPELHELDRHSESAYLFEAILAKPDCDGLIINNMGQYLAIDSRPVSCSKGPLKQIVAIYKSHLRSVNICGDTRTVVDPFLCLNIICPLGSYDVNIEPAKDDVLFTDTELLVDLAQKFFKNIYGELSMSESDRRISKTLEKPQGIELMLAKKRPAPPRIISDTNTQSETSQQNPKSSLGAISQHQSLADSMDSTNVKCSISASNPQKRAQPSRLSAVTAFANSIEAEDGIPKITSLHSPAGSAQGSESDDDHHLRSVQVSNPWAFAKLNAPFRSPARGSGQDEKFAGNNPLPTPYRQSGDACNSSAPSSDDVQLTPPPAPGLPTPRRSQRLTVAQPVGSSPPPFPFPLRARGNRRYESQSEDRGPFPQESSQRGSLDPWIEKSRINQQENDKLLDINDGSTRGQHGPPDIARSGNFVSARSLPRDIPLSDIPDVGDKSRRKVAPRKRQRQEINSDSSCLAPVNDLKNVWFDTSEKPTRNLLRRPAHKNAVHDPRSLVVRDGNDSESSNSPHSESPTAPIHPDLALTLDYEARKQIAMQQHRESLQRSRRLPAKDTRSNFDKSVSSPHKNRQKAAIAALHKDSNTLDHFLSKSIPNPFEAEDPRAYLIRTKQAEREDTNGRAPQLRRLKRRKTSMLPFETLLEKDYTGDLVQTIPTKPLNFATLLRTRGAYDDYVSKGVTTTDAFSNCNETQIRDWERRLKTLVKSLYRIEGMAAKDDMDGELECDLSCILGQRARSA